jgi:diguanylate cyclase (GGDEF)-like protein
MNRPRRLKLRSQLAIWAAVKTMALTLVLTGVSVITVTRQMEGETASDLGILAADVAQAFDHRMSLNYRVLEMAAGIDVLRDRWASPYQKSAALTNLQATFADARWIGIAGLDGLIKASSQIDSLNIDVGHEDWFLEGQRHPSITTLHHPDDYDTAFHGAAEPDRVIDIAMPLRDPIGNVRGVLAASISWKWAVEFRDLTLRNHRDKTGIDILVTDASGRILLGPPALMGSTITLTTARLDTTHQDSPRRLPIGNPSRDGNLVNNFGMKVQHWPDRGHFVSAVGTGTGYQNFPGLGWNIVVRQPRDIAYAPARAIRNELIIGGAALAIFFAGIGWLVAGRVTSSIGRLTGFARRLDRGERGLVFGGDAGSREVQVLAETLDHMVGNLLQREQQLLDLNTTLEQRIDERTALLATSNRQLEDEMAQRQAMEAEREALTGALNRRAFLAMAERDRRRLRRDDGRIAVIMFDIDHFKRVNDSYGHATGDEVIRKMAETARAVVREGDLLCRYGGEEFALLLADPGADCAVAVAERLRSEVATLSFTATSSSPDDIADDEHHDDGHADVAPRQNSDVAPRQNSDVAPRQNLDVAPRQNSDVAPRQGNETPFHVTISLGVTIAATRDLPEDGIATLLDHADQALYGAKRGGRNRTMIDQRAIATFARDMVQVTASDYAHNLRHDFPRDFSRDFPRDFQGDIPAPQVANDS